MARPSKRSWDRPRAPARWRRVGASPPESMDGNLCASPARPTRLSSSVARPCAVLCHRPKSQLRAEQHVVGAVRQGTSRGDWNTKAMSDHACSGARPSTVHTSVVRVEQAADDTQRGGLAAPRRAEDADEFAAPNVEAQAVVNSLIAERDVDILEWRMIGFKSMWLCACSFSMPSHGHPNPLLPAASCQGGSRRIVAGTRFRVTEERLALPGRKPDAESSSRHDRPIVAGNSQIESARKFCLGPQGRAVMRASTARSAGPTAHHRSRPSRGPLGLVARTLETDIEAVDQIAVIRR